MFSEEESILLLRLWRVFSSIPKPSNFFYIEPGEISEKDDLNRFSALNWDSIEIKELNNCQFGLNYLTPKAFKYVLPRLLSLLVEYGNSIASMPFVDSMFYMVDQYDFPSLIVDFSDDQKRIYAEIMDHYFADNENYPTVSGCQVSIKKKILKT